ncbi:serpin family protein [Kitasatospora sp. NPDC096147]|uniref:serpin family protein n=1 Tax=Kitasatospora sp. NPDC096147 TaxID=3364093 RepID=UPI00380878F6
MGSSRAVVGAVNALAARWASVAVAEGRNTVFSPVGVWPLLGLLADGAGGDAREELAEAVGLPAGAAAEGARQLLAELGRMPGVAAAVGLWTDRRAVPEPAWVAALPEATLGELTGDSRLDRTRLDAWAEKVTNGLIPSMPVDLDEQTRLVLASGLSLRTRWIRPFYEGLCLPEVGPWADRHWAGLDRTTGLLDRAAVLRGEAGAVTELSVLGYDDLEVRLLLGEEGRPPAEVLRTGIAALSGRGVERVTADVVPASEAGPGMYLEHRRSWHPDPLLNARTVSFGFEAEHDLLRPAAPFGLGAASDTARGHFPGISRSEPLAIASARQRAIASFRAKGFEAAAVTALGMAGAGLDTRRPPYRIRDVTVCYDRPFGFLAIHRHSRVVLAAGWVAEPTAYREPLD